ncbi:MAG: hypothetical protein QNJ45_25970 [Ardenticatenaceae bacterium]|nr:hypothetical protein [Ardenticatenaceae bacterium]
MKKFTVFFFLITLLSGCGAEEQVSVTGTEPVTVVEVDSVISGEAEPAGQEETDQPSRTGFSLEFGGELSSVGALALATLQLEDAAVPIDQSQADGLLPLWEALQTLANSDTAAELELQAVADQIENSLTEEQQMAMMGMDLSMEAVNDLMASGQLAGPGGRGGNGTAGSGQGGFGGGQGGFGGGQGGGPGGGQPPSEEDLATRQAAFSGSDAAEQVLINAVIRQLNEILGVSNPRQIINETVNQVVSTAAGLTVEELQGKFDAGLTIPDVLAEAGVDIAQVQAELLAALQAADLGGNFDPQAIVEGLFSDE